MGRIDERISAQFAAWEERGRGWQVRPKPILPEPAFREFTGYELTTAQPRIDDGRRPGFLASLFDTLHQQVAPKPPVMVEALEEPEPNLSEHPLTTEFIAAMPGKLDVRSEAMRAFFDSLNVCTGPTAFELFGREDRVSVQLASSPHDAPAVQRQLTAFLPQVPFIQTEGVVAGTWDKAGGVSFVVEFGLAYEFMLPLRTEHPVDPFVGLVGALSELRTDETALFQVLFQAAQQPWANSVWRSVTDRDGKMLFINKPPLIPGTKAKLESPLFGVVVRAAAQAESFDHAALIVQNMARSLHTFARAENNELIPLHNDDYPFEAHVEDLLLRQSRRSGMLLNREELLGFVHLPGDEVRSPKLKRQTTGTKAAPNSVVSPGGLLLGINEHAGRSVEVRLTAEQRTRHTHIIGASGTGKSTLLFNLIQQDIQNGEGIAVLDPHGDLIERVLGVIPPERIHDVVLLDPTDEQFSIGFNILSAHSDFEKNLLASDLVSVFRRLSSSWGDQLNSVLNNAILAFLESSQGGTLADLRRFLLDAEFRNDFLQTVRDPDIIYYWRKAFPQLGGNKSIGPVLTRLDTFLGPKPIRYMVSQNANRLDFAEILDSGKIFLAKLPQGQIGKENSLLLGSLLVSKFQQLAMSRQRMSKDLRRDFWLYIDEFQNFITPSMAEILTDARKYRIGLILAHQELHQLQKDSDVASAVLSNPYTRVVFRVGDADARTLERGFASFVARDIQNLETGHAIARVERTDGDFNLSVPLPEEIERALATEIRNRVITASREKYATPRTEIEAALSKAAEAQQPKSSPPPPRLKREAKTESTPPPLAPVPPPEKPAVPEPVVEIQKPAPRPSAEGIGGAQHQTTQKRIKEAAEALGFFAVIEKQIPQGSVDLWLQRSGFTIACEISVTTTIDHEFGNVRKCLEANFNQVAVISSSPARLDKIEQAVSGGLGEATTDRVGYYSPDDFIVWLKTLAAVESAPVSSEPSVTIRRGRKVTRKIPNLTPEEMKQKEKERIALIAEVMRIPPQ